MMSAIILYLGILAWLLSLVQAERPLLPLSTSSRWIVDAAGKRVKLRCINWAGHMEVNLPEGLHKKPLEYVADWIRDEGFNCVRLTFSIDHALNPDISAEESFRRGAAAASIAVEDFMPIYSQAVTHNPFLANATQRGVFSRVIDALWERDVMTVLDNHVSRASWCCNLIDGNGWWKEARFYSALNSRYFGTDAWIAGLESVARWASDHEGVVALGLRNELRATWSQIPFSAADWRDFISRGAAAVHAANPRLLVVMGGLHSATDLTPLHVEPFDDSRWRGKTVWEAHEYPFTVTTPDIGRNCDIQLMQYGLLYGFVLEQDRPYTGPLWMSEFGVNMQGGEEAGLSESHYAYLTCFVSWLENNDADWALWAVQGSYYVRDGQIDYDETWAALDRDWNAWRNRAFKELLGSIFNVTQGPVERSFSG
ncbi:cellulase [Sodiomyces alkalinus F11]|uniref:Cellulase n=1 Tax=Sodiomyces alkalinus (strain CBS 110278 / VKM F-3762 / F11) TaxID=1314773 RepID=A0A3N2Q7U9_SODAK|nr:cellulase [Sodiomyces alkalinus F11]ROT42786.1 cellulase [Sodiomyces alkalinus F11]